MDNFLKTEEESSASDGTGSRLLAELNLIPRAIEQTCTSISNRVEHLANNPGEFATMAGSATLLGTGITLAARSRRFGSEISAAMPWIMGTACAADLTYRVVLPTTSAIRGTWDHPGQLNHHASNLGSSYGTTFVDYGLMGVSGYAGMRGAALLRSSLVRRTTLGQDLGEISAAIEDNFVRPPGLQKYRFDSNMNGALTSYQRHPNGYHQLPAHELDITAKKLETAINAVLTKKGLPEVEVGWAPSETSAAGCLNGQGKIQYNPYFLVRGPKHEIVRLGVHEITHFDQEVLVGRRIADQMGIGIKPEPPQLEAFRIEFGKYTKEVPTDSFIERILTARNGRPLDPSQAARADALITNEVIASKVRDDTRSLENRLNAVNEAALRTQQHGTDVASRLLHNEADRKLLLGTDTLTPEIRKAAENLQKQSSLATQWAYGQDRVVIYNALKAESGKINAQLKVETKNYYNLLEEAEAFDAGNKAGWDATFNRGYRRILFGSGTAAMDGRLLRETGITNGGRTILGFSASDRTQR